MTDTTHPARRLRHGQRPEQPLYFGPDAGQPRRWAALITSAGHGVLQEYGTTFEHALPGQEIIEVMEMVPAPASTVLTDERINELWDETPTADAETLNKVRRRFARAIEREVAAQAGQVAVPEGWSVERVGDAIHIKRADGRWCGYMHEIDSPAHRLTHEFLSAMLAAAPSAPAVAQQAPAPGQAEIEWSHDVQERLIAAGDGESDEARGLMAEAASLLAAITGRPAPSPAKESK